MPVGNAFFTAALIVIINLLGLYKFILIVSVVLSWLVSFEVVNPYNRFVRMIGDITHRLTEPALRPLRRIIPPINGLDLAPLALFALIWFAQIFLQMLMERL